MSGTGVPRGASSHPGMVCHCRRTSLSRPVCALGLRPPWAARTTGRRPGPSTEPAVTRSQSPAQSAAVHLGIIFPPEEHSKHLETFSVAASEGEAGSGARPGLGPRPPRRTGRPTAQCSLRGDMARPLLDLRSREDSEAARARREGSDRGGRRGVAWRGVAAWVLEIRFL